MEAAGLTDKTVVFPAIFSCILKYCVFQLHEEHEAYYTISKIHNVWLHKVTSLLRSQGYAEEVARAFHFGLEKVDAAIV